MMNPDFLHALRRAQEQLARSLLPFGLQVRSLHTDDLVQFQFIFPDRNSGKAHYFFRTESVADFCTDVDRRCRGIAFDILFRALESVCDDLPMKEEGSLREDVIRFNVLSGGCEPPPPHPWTGGGDPSPLATSSDLGSNEAAGSRSCSMKRVKFSIDFWGEIEGNELTIVGKAVGLLGPGDVITVEGFPARIMAAAEHANGSEVRVKLMAAPVDAIAINSAGDHLIWPLALRDVLSIGKPSFVT